MIVTLNQAELAELMKQDPSVANDGGWQSLIDRLQRTVNVTTGEIDLDDGVIERIGRYAFSYGNGGWEGTLKAIFSRTLGPTLDGKP